MQQSKNIPAHLKKKYFWGIPIALAVIILWFISTYYLLTLEINYKNPMTWFFILLQTHLYTGLFITAHDAMHGTVSLHRKTNEVLGTLAALLFAFNWFPRLKTKHYQHHNFVATEKDPDFYNGNFIAWYFNFVKNYITVWQIIAMAITFNILNIFFAEANIIIFWMLPSIFSTLQLFYFGTYLPHKGQHAVDNLHKSSSQNKNHIFAFLSCYFFGYHYEHHDSPATPWWLLYRKK